jgi:hypothetical protein
MRMHPVLMSFQVATDRSCEFCKGSGITPDREICYCVTMYYGQPISRRTAEMIKADLKKFREDGKYASLRNS